MGIHIGHLILALIIIYIAYHIKSKYEKNLVVIYLDKQGNITNIDPPLEINIFQDDIKLEKGYYADHGYNVKNMIYLLIKPITHKYKRETMGNHSITHLLSIPSCEKCLRIKECY